MPSFDIHTGGARRAPNGQEPNGCAFPAPQGPTLDDPTGIGPPSCPGRRLSAGGTMPNRSARLAPLGLSPEDKTNLIAFLLALTGDDPVVRPPRIPY